MINKHSPENPYYRRPDKPCHLRRALHHDYTRPARYMITLHKSEETPILSSITGNLSVTDPAHPDFPRSIPGKAGAMFLEALDKWNLQYPQIQTDSVIIMPDHIHLCIDVKRHLPTGLSRAIANLMGKATAIRHAIQHPGSPDKTADGNNNTVTGKTDSHQSSDTKKQPFFTKGYNDSIAYTDQQYQTQLQYILDNPRRLLMKREFPDLFRMRWIITAGNIQVAAIGNIHLLKKPHLQVVRFSRRYTADRLKTNNEAWHRCLENGGVLISPFIHPVEKDMKAEAIAKGGNIIRICENGFSERFAPSKTEFDLMGTHRLLLIAPVEYTSQKKDLKYSFAQKLNSIAELLASRPANMRIRPASKSR